MRANICRYTGASPASRDRGGKIKIKGAKVFAEFFWPKSQLISKKIIIIKGFRRDPKAFSDRNRKFSDQKQVISKKNKVFAEIRRLFLAEIANFNVFFRPIRATSSSQKIPLGGQEKNWEGKYENRGGIASPAPPLATRLPL